MSRYLVGGLVQRYWETAFPIGTLFVNITGSFLIGVILRYALTTPSFSPEIRGFLTIGFCGGYTTFSTFSYETIALLDSGEWGRAGWYVAASVFLSVAATFLGIALAREVIVLQEHL